MDEREILMDNSDAFNEAKDHLTNDYLRNVDSRNNRYKEIKWNGYLMFKEMELKIVDGMMFFGAEFDDLYIGRVQNWSEIEPHNNYHSMP